jgi:hypothetical protein
MSNKETTIVKNGNVNYQKLGNAWYSQDGKMAPAAIVAQLEAQAKPIEQSGEFWAGQNEKTETKVLQFKQLKEMSGQKLGMFFINKTTRKTDTKAPDFRGQFTVGGVAHNVSGWESKGRIDMNLQTADRKTVSVGSLYFGHGFIQPNTQRKSDKSPTHFGRFGCFNDSTKQFESLQVAGWQDGSMINMSLSQKM